MLFLTGLALVAAPAAIQPVGTPPAAAEAKDSGNAVAVAANAYAGCVTKAATGAAADATPQSVLAGCAAERSDLDKAVNALIDTMPEEKQADARKEYQDQMSDAESTVASAIEDKKSAEAAAAKQGPASPK